MSKQHHGRRSLSWRNRAVPARCSVLLLALVRRARRFWLVWLEERWAALRARRNDFRANWQRWHAAMQPPTGAPARFESLEPRLLLSADLLPLDAVAPVGVHQLIEQYVAAAHPATAGMAFIQSVAAPVAPPPVVVTGPGSAQLVQQGSS